MHAISSYHGNRPTNTQTDRQDRLQYTVSLSLACSVTILVHANDIHYPHSTMYVHIMCSLTEI